MLGCTAQLVGSPQIQRPVAASAYPAAPSRRIRTHRSRTAAYDFGVEAERHVAFYLNAGGYQILGRRVRVRGGEIDIVAARDDTVALVEVKARRQGWDGLLSVNTRKQRRLSRAADSWLSQNEHFAGFSIRFDVALVWQNREIEYLENAFDHIEADDFVW